MCSPMNAASDWGGMVVLMIACFRCLDSGKQVKSYVASTKRNTRGDWGGSKKIHLSWLFYLSKQSGWWWIVGGFGTRTKGTSSWGPRHLWTFWNLESRKWHFQGYFPPWTPCCFVTMHARLRTLPSKCPRCSKTSHTSTFHRSNPVKICAQCHSKLGNGCFTILFDGAYFLLAVMVEGD